MRQRDGSSVIEYETGESESSLGMTTKEDKGTVLLSSLGMTTKD